MSVWTICRIIPFIHKEQKQNIFKACINYVTNAIAHYLT